MSAANYRRVQGSSTPNKGIGTTFLAYFLRPRDRRLAKEPTQIDIAQRNQILGRPFTPTPATSGQAPQGRGLTELTLRLTVGITTR
jgi:hypothetical protein